MSFFTNRKRICDGCICHILDDFESPNIKNIDKTIFHNNICCLHYTYIIKKENKIEKERYEQDGKNYFIEIVEFNIEKHQIRDATIAYLASYISMFFST